MEKQFEATQDEMRLLWEARCRQAGIADKHIGKGFSAYQGPDNLDVLEKVKAYERDFSVSSGRGLVFCGGPGTGKTLLASILSGYLCAKGHAVRFFVWPDFLIALEESRRFDSRVSHSQLLSDIAEYDLLVLDDIGVPVVTPQEREKAYLYEVIDSRDRSEKPLVLVGNLNPGELESYLGDRCLDRVIGKSRLCVFRGQGWRRKQQGVS